MKKIFILLGIPLLAAGCAAQSTTQSSHPVQLYNYSHQLQVGSQILNVEIANTQAEQEQGLSGRSSMQANQGMLFDFGNSVSTTPAFWMKDMNFNLDFIWINKNKIVGITPNVPRPVNCKSADANCLPLYYPPSPANQVLEVNAGWAEKNNINVGDNIELISK